MRYILSVTLVLAFTTSAFAIGELKKEWTADYLGDDASEDFKVVGRKAGCYVCHVKDEDKKKPEGRNEYGLMMSKFLESKKVSIEDLKNEYKDEATKEAAQKKIKFMFEKVGEQKSKDGEKFIDKIKAGKLPATDAGL
ncbi:MAG: hypothetical protein HKN47_01425 [Pirellulaceae bacterium]|nr:hypothetical protein [Pirellulaceae bacterium]